MKQSFIMPTGDTITKDMPRFKTPWNHDTTFESQRTALFCNDPSLTKQEFVEETNINTILERFTRTGTPPPMVLPEHFMDLTSRSSYFEYASAAAEANTLFYLLPPKIRAQFLNDPNRWADSVVKAVEEGDRDSLESWGIQVPEKPQEPTSDDPPARGSSSSDQTVRKAPAGPKPGDKPPAPGPGPDNPPSDNGK